MCLLKKIISKIFYLRFSLLIIFFLTFGFVNAGLLFAQPESKLNSTLTGKIFDENKIPVALAYITLQEFSASTQSNKQGDFIFSNIPEGAYHLTINRSGFLNKTVVINLISADTVFQISLEKSLIETSTIDVTGSFNPTDIRNSTFSITSIGPRTLGRIRSENIASTIQNTPGINNLSTGSSIGKPIIRGLSFQSVLILHDGIKHESQLWGDEHGPEIAVFNIDRIEILRGPASLMYGSDGIGGVVNIISKPLQFSNSPKIIKYGGLTLNGFSVNEEAVGNFNLGIGTQNFSTHGYIGYREGKNINTPNGELLVNTPYGSNLVEGGRLFNTGDKEFQAGINLGAKGDYGNFNISFENFNRELQLHENPKEEPDATPNQKIVTNNFDIKGDFILSKRIQLEPVFSFENQNRIEYESTEDKENNEQALNLDMNLYQSDLRLHNLFSEILEGTLGVSLIFGNTKSTAEEKLIPNSTAVNYGIYAGGTLKKKYYTLSGGIRFDSKDLNIKETVFEYDEKGNPSNVVNSQSLGFNSLTGSIGCVLKPISNLDIFANAGTGWRPTSEFELFVNGIHEGAGRFEIGLMVNDPDYKPDPENSVNFDLGTRIRYKIINGEISLYSNFVNSFVFPMSTGEIDSSSGLPIYNIIQDNSTFSGYEYSFQIQPVSWFLLTLKGDYVNTLNKATAQSLPFTPPAKNIIELKFEKSNFWKLYNLYLNAGTKIVADAPQVGELESSTPSYTLFNAGFGFDCVLSKSIASIDFIVTNLANKKYVDHLSRYRYYAMNPGRSFNLKVSIPFYF